MWFSYLSVKITNQDTFSWLQYISKALSKVLRKYWPGWEGGWYIPPKSHLLFLKFNSTNKPLILSRELCFLNILLGMSSLTYMIIPFPIFISVLSVTFRIPVNMQLRNWKCIVQFCYCNYQNIKHSRYKFVKLFWNRVNLNDT